MRFRNIEFRWSKGNNKYELVKWYKNDNDGENCYVVAFFDKDKEGYDLRTIGSRFVVTFTPSKFYVSKSH